MVSVARAWSAIEKVVPREQLAAALAVIAETVPDDDGDGDAEWRRELVARYGTVRCFIKLLVEVIDFGGRGRDRGGQGSQAAARADRAEEDWRRGDRPRPGDRLVAPARVRRPGAKAGAGGQGRVLLLRAGATAPVAAAARHLRQRRRPWGDPRTRLLSGDRWVAAQPKVLTALGLEAEPAGHLAEIASQLHAAYVQVAAGLPGNTAVQVEGGKLKLDKLGKAADPKLMPPFRQLVNNMLPAVDFPELLLEVAELTDLPDAFTHISGAPTTMEDFAVSLCAVWLSEACNVGMTPVIKPDMPALTRGRLVQVDQGYFRAENISAGNGLFIEAQAKIDAARAWGGGLVASADGVRFTVPVKSLYSGHSPKYFGLRHKGATWLNVINDQVMGLGGVVVPGTLRDSLFILDAIHARDGGPKPETVITDTASYVVTWTPLVPQAPLETGFSQFASRAGHRSWRCQCGSASSVWRTGRSVSSCSTRTVSRSRSSRGSCGRWRPGTTRPTHWSPTPTTFSTYGASSTATA